MNDQTKQEAMNFFGRRLKALIDEKGFTPKEVAKAAGISYQHLNHLMNGSRTITVEILKKVKEGLELSNDEIASLSLLRNEPEIKDGKKSISAMVANRSGERTKGRFLFLKEDMVHEKYPEYHGDDFVTYALRYIYETFYDKKFKDLEEEKKRNRLISDAVDLKANNQFLNEIVELLHDLPTKNLIYVKESLQLYIKHHIKED